jgi:hypothetical protein
MPRNYQKTIEGANFEPSCRTSVIPPSVRTATLLAILLAGNLTICTHRAPSENVTTTEIVRDDAPEDPFEVPTRDESRSYGAWMYHRGQLDCLIDRSAERFVEWLEMSTPLHFQSR